MSAHRRAPPRRARAERGSSLKKRRALGLVAAGYSCKEICALTWWTSTKVNRCGVFKVVRPAWASIGLVTVGALAGALAALWTTLALFLSIALIVLTVLRTTSAGATTAATPKSPEST